MTRFYWIMYMLLVLTACSKKHDAIITPSNTNPTPTVPTTNATEVLSTVYIDNPTGARKLKCRLFIPATATKVPAVVVMHGSGGLWKNNDTAGHVMNAQFDEWIDSFRKYNIAALFIDSYSARNEIEFKEVAPPDNIPLAAEFVRPRDAYKGLEYLRTLPNIKGDKIALLGFSHGGTTVLSAMVNAAAVAKATPWSLRYNNVTYTNGVLAPATPPAGGGFVACVSYYPGCGFYSYYGSPNNAADGKYVTYAPILLIAAGKDPLYADNNYYQTLVDKNILNGGSANNNTQIELKIYPNAAHSFDGKTSGDDQAASIQAKTLALEHLKKYF